MLLPADHSCSHRATSRIFTLLPPFLPYRTCFPHISMAASPTSFRNLLKCHLLQNPSLTTLFYFLLLPFLFINWFILEYIALECCVRFCCTAKWVSHTHTYIWASQVVLVVKNPTANAGDLRDAASIPGSGRSPVEEMATHFSILAWRIPWTKESGGLQSIGLQRVGHNWSICACIHAFTYSLFFRFPSHLGHNRTLNRVPCSIL